MSRQQDYVHALRFRALNRFYDPIVRWTTREEEFKSRLVAQVDWDHGRVLDVGCGTGTLLSMLGRRWPQARLTGLDGDAGVLAIARDKLDAAGVDAELVHAMAGEAVLTPALFTRVVSSLFFHHLERSGKLRVLQWIHDLLEPGGELHIADWGEARSVLARGAFLAVQLLDGFSTTQDNVTGRLVSLIEEAGFETVRETQRLATVFGTLSLYRAVRA